MDCKIQEVGKIGNRKVTMQIGDVKGQGFTLVELLVVISIISLLTAIIVPALNMVRAQARSIVSANNQKQIIIGINFFASDNYDSYPDSVATIGFGDNWNWTDPTRMTGNRKRSPRLYRSMSHYLKDYISDASLMFCPNAPDEYRYLQQSWDAGDNWDNPETSFEADPVGGTYCFYWNYIGNVNGRLFRGPAGPSHSGGRYSKLIISDYFGYDHWRNPSAFSSCENFHGAGITPETLLLSSFWSKKALPEDYPEIQLRAGYSDGHVETYSSLDVIPMKVSITSDGQTPYPEGLGPGTFFLPRNAMQ